MRTGKQFQVVRLKSAIGFIAAAGTVAALAGCGSGGGTVGGSSRGTIGGNGQTATNIVYTETNDPAPGKNAILAFHRNPTDGSLTPFASPFLTGGTGVSNPQFIDGPDDADQNVIVNPEHTLLFAVNGGSNNVSVFHIGSDGSLTPVNGSPFASGGVEPASLGLAGNHLYVVNKNQDPGQYTNPDFSSFPFDSPTGANRTGFTVNGDGSLSPIPNSTIGDTPTASASQALIARGGQILIDAEEGNPAQMRSFVIDPSGLLMEAPGSPIMPPAVNGVATQPLGLIEHPTLPIVYVGFVNTARLGVYKLDESSGAMTLVTHVSNAGQEICWLTVSPDGKSLYSSNMLDSSVSRYDLSDPMNPVEVQHLVLPEAMHGGTFELSTDPSGKFLYVITARGIVTQNHNDPSGNAINVFSIGPDGNLSPTPTVVPLSVTTAPAYLAAHPQGLAVL